MKTGVTRRARGLVGIVLVLAMAVGGTEIVQAKGASPSAATPTSSVRRGVLSSQTYLSRVHTLLSRYGVNKRFAVAERHDDALLLSAGANIGMMLSIDRRKRVTGFILSIAPSVNSQEVLQGIFVEIASVIALKSSHTTQKRNIRIKNKIGFEGDFSRLIGGEEYRFVFRGNPRANYTITSFFNRATGFMLTADIQKREHSK